MKIKCSHCFKTTDVTFDHLIFENEDEELFVAYLNCELVKLQKKDHLPEEDYTPKEIK